ncbi:MAG: hypothetical protein Q8R67_05695 [Rhodoferax sp.]|nr:hypothetical protein [Rhodoferax sp.]MDP3651162.1 hypothetical protein [Rhodoferax sp.]
MPVLTLAYRCCDRMLPRYIKHSEVEGIAMLARQQLVDANTDAISLSVLRDIGGLKINGIQFELWVDTDHAVNDEQGNPVLGVCEFDPAASLDATVLSVSPVSETASEELVLSTFAHELGHAIFDAPSWIAAAAKGPGLFDDPTELARKAYRTTTRDAEHLAKPPVALELEPRTARNSELDRSIHFAELRANEFMGSLLVPRQQLCRAVEELAPKHGVTIHRSPSLDPEVPGTTLRLTADGDIGFFDMECLQKALAKRFGVHRRFIQVRMERYGLLASGAGIA